MTMQKNEVVTLEITDINNLGFGVGRCDGKVVFVAGAVSGDRVSARIIKVNKSWCVGKLEEILVPSPHRTEEKYCSAPENCGGCVYRNVTYGQELLLKKEYVKNAFRKCGLPDVAVNDVLTADVPMEDAIIATEYDNLHLVPTNIALAGAEFELFQHENSEYRMKEALAPIKDDFDYILIDCMPSLGMMTKGQHLASA